MIKYRLICDHKHSFDSWFASADAFESLQRTRMISCPVCGSSSVTKAIMAPAVRSGESSPEPKPTPPAAEEHPLSTPASPAEQALAELRRNIEANSDYVGKDFAREARAIHTGDAPKRSIHGEANIQETRSLMEDGIPIIPLPFGNGRKTN